MASAENHTYMVEQKANMDDVETLGQLYSHKWLDDVQLLEAYVRRKRTRKVRDVSGSKREETDG